MTETQAAGEVPALAAASRGRRASRPNRGLRLLALVGPIALLLGAASPAVADARAIADHAPTHWVGRYCTTRACADARPAPLSHAAGFGAAVLGALWLAGRRSAKS